LLNRAIQTYTPRRLESQVFINLSLTVRLAVLVFFSAHPRPFSSFLVREPAQARLMEAAFWEWSTLPYSSQFLPSLCFFHSHLPIFRYDAEGVQ
jgi:hypothetical protein